MNKINIDKVEDLRLLENIPLDTQEIIFLTSTMSRIEMIQGFGQDRKEIVNLSVPNPFADSEFISGLVSTFANVLNDTEIKEDFAILVKGHPDKNIRNSLINEIIYRSLDIYNRINTKLLILHTNSDSKNLDENKFEILEEYQINPSREFNIIIAMHTTKKAPITNQNFTMYKEQDITPKVYISYKHLNKQVEANEDYITKITEALEHNNIYYSIDRKDLNITDNLREYEKKIGEARVIIVIITQEYLKSLQCMNELQGIINHGRIHERVIPLVEISDEIRSSKGLAEIKSFWENERKDKMGLMASNGSSMTSDEVTIISQIHNSLDRIWEYINKYITGTISEVLENNAEKLIQAIKKICPDIANNSEKRSINLTTREDMMPPQPLTRTITTNGNSTYVENNNGTIIINK